MTTIDLKGLTLLITGASQGIGKELAHYAMKMGACVAVHYNRHKKDAKALVKEFEHTGSETFQAGLQNMEVVQHLFK